jgi:hypothetical protein
MIGGCDRDTRAIGASSNRACLDDEKVVGDANDRVAVCVVKTDDVAAWFATVSFDVERQSDRAVRPGALAVKFELNQRHRRFEITSKVLGANTLTSGLVQRDRERELKECPIAFVRPHDRLL